VDRLVQSRLFDIVVSDNLPRIDHNTRFRRNFCILKLNDILFGVDTWDYTAPTVSGHDLFHSLNAIIKVQWNGDSQLYQHVERKYNLIVSPCSMFHYADFLRYEKKFKWDAKPKKRLCFFSGMITKQRGQRRNLFQELVENNIYKRLDDWCECFYKESKQSMWGLVLQGQSGDLGDGKNRRTVAYASWNMPLALDYIPHYPVNFEPNIDFMYVKTIQDILNLKEIDPVPFSKRSALFYQRCLSPEGGAKLLINILNRAKQGRRYHS